MAVSLPDVATKSQGEAREALADALTRQWNLTYTRGEDNGDQNFGIEDMRSMAYDAIKLVQETIGSSVDRLAEAQYDVEHANGKNALNAMGTLVAAVKSVIIDSDKILGGER